MKRLVITSLFAIILSAYLSAQAVVSTAGDFHSKASGSISWTLGETVIDTYSKTNTALTQGFQQIKVIISAIQETQDNLEVKIYPNPTCDFVFLKTSDVYNKKLKIVLLDFQGKMLLEQKIINTETKIPVNSLIPGIYMLKISDNNSFLKGFKIIKQ